MNKAQKILWSFVAIAFLIFIAISLPTKKDNSLPEIMPVAGFNKGEHFILTSQDGKIYDSKSALKDGDYALIFFGFTHCPVICPTELQKMAVVMDMVPTEIQNKLQPLFITIDPERDTVDIMQAYVPMFHEKIMGLTGDTKKIHKVLNDWKVYYTKVDDPQFTEYTMDHSTYSYLVDSDMNIKAIYRLQNTEGQIADSITKIVR